MRGGTRKRGETWTWFFDAVDPVTGKRRQRSKGGFRTKRAAQAALGDALAAYRAGTLVEPSKLTLGAFLDEWLPAMAGSLEPNTHEVYGHYARAYVKPRLGHLRLQQLTATNLRGFYTELAASGGRRGQGLKPKTVKNVHALIHRALEDAVDQGLMTRNVAALRSARPPKLEKTERGVWTPQSLRAFLAAMAGRPACDGHHGPAPAWWTSRPCDPLCQLSGLALGIRPKLAASPLLDRRAGATSSRISIGGRRSTGAMLCETSRSSTTLAMATPLIAMTQTCQLKQ